MDDQENKLQQVFGFTPDDLRENRQGRLTAVQAGRLRGEAARVLYLVVGALALIGIMAMISFRASANELFMLISCLVVPGLITFAFTFGLTESAIGPRVVSKTSGLLHRSYGFTGYEPPLDAGQIRSARTFMFGQQAAYRIVVGEKEFRLDKDRYEALTPGYYTVYFVPTLNKIVSIQRIDPESETGFSPKLKRDKPLIIAPDLPDEGEETIRA